MLCGIATTPPSFCASSAGCRFRRPTSTSSVVLQPTEGCHYNRCTFCDLYRDRPFRIKTPAEFRNTWRR